MPDTYQLPHVPIEQFTLANGLRVVLNPDSSAPVISVAVYYDTGSRNEKPGRTGFAHLFEHMMFQGSENLPKGAHFQYIFNNGGTMNGTTTSERTNYFETLPANQLPLALWLESDRMRSLKVTEENLDNQREAVKEEKRLRVDNQPYINAFLLMDEMIFKNPANAHSTIGSMEDLDAATVEDVREFFRIYYAPNNAVLTISGDFDSTEARALVEKYFATIPRQPDPPGVDSSEPAEIARRRDTYRDMFAPLAAFIVGWKIPQRRTEAFYALSEACELLFDGESSRLYQKLIKGEESVVQLQGSVDERRGPSAITLFVTPKPGHDAVQIRQTIMSEIRRLATLGPTDDEMLKLHNSLFNDAVHGRQMSLFRAQRLSEFALYDNDPTLFNTEPDRYLNVRAEQIREAVARYMDTDNCAVLVIIPEAVASASPAPSATAQAPVDAGQPAAPPPQLPSEPTVEPVTGDETAQPLPVDASALEPTEQPTDESPRT